MDEVRAASGPEFDRLAALSEEAWYERILAGYQPDSAPQGVLCGYPSEELQANTVGCAGRAALTFPFRFWVDVRQSCGRLGVALTPSTRILDFGCGWGRITRFFFRDTSPENITGIDVDTEFIGICRRIMSGGTYQVVDPLPPTDLPSGSFELVVGYSVFSHLAQHAADAWMKELARLLKPGGLLAVTIRPRQFLDYCESLKGTKARVRRWLSAFRGTRAPAHPYLEALAGMFPDFGEARRRYDAGEFVYAPLGGGGPRDRSFYGEALIPERYVRQAWAPHLLLRDFRFDPDRHELTLMVLQKPQEPQASGATTPQGSRDPD